MPDVKVYFIVLLAALSFLAFSVSKWGLPTDNYYEIRLKEAFTQGTVQFSVLTGAFLSILLFIDFIEGLVSELTIQGILFLLLIVSALLVSLFLFSTLQKPSFAFQFGN